MNKLRVLVLIALGLAGAWCPAKAVAQDPAADYNRARAYRHYLTSPYSFRTYSDLGAARAWGYDTPLESGRFWQSPYYYHEEMSPRGRWTSAVPPRVEGYVMTRPVIIYPPAYPYPPPP
jgi:hypothetical protein